MQEAHEYELANVLHEKVRKRYQLLGNDAVTAFLIFYGRLIKIALDDVAARYDRPISIPLILTVLIADLMFGMPVRYTLHSSHWNAVKRLSECWSFFMGVMLYVSVQILVESVATWIDQRTAMSAGAWTAPLTSLFYTFYIVSICVFLQNMRAASHREYKSQIQFTNRLAFGVAMIVSDIYFSNRFSPVAYTGAVIMAGIVPLIIFLERITKSLSPHSFIHQTPSRQIWTHQMKFISSVVKIVVRVLTFILTQSVLNRTAELNTHLLDPARITIPVLVLLACSSFVAAAMNKQTALGSMFTDHTDLLQDFLFGLTIFVSRIAVAELQRRISSALQQLVVVAFVFILAVIFAAEVVFESLVYVVEHDRAAGSMYMTLRSWIDIFNRLVIYIVIQLIVATDWSTHQQTRVLFIFVYTFPILFLLFSIFPDLGEMQTEHINTPNSKK